MVRSLPAVRPRYGPALHVYCPGRRDRGRRASAGVATARSCWSERMEQILRTQCRRHSWPRLALIDQNVGRAGLVWACALTLTVGPNVHNVRCTVEEALQVMKSRYILFAAIVAVAAVSCATPGDVAAPAGAAAPTTVVPAPPPDKGGPQPPAQADPSPVQTVAPNAAQCGDWDLPTSSFGQSQAKYGEQVACFSVEIASGPVWVVVRDGATAAVTGRVGGAVGVDRCSSVSTTCADGRTNHGSDSWQWYPVPGGEEATLWGVEGSVVEVSTAADVYLFDVASASPTFVPRPKVASS